MAQNVQFTKEMKRTHTILLPDMLPIHFKLISQVMQQYGYKTQLLQNAGHQVVEEGLKNVHNDTCYPALLVIGQMIDALKSGRYDTHRVALMITQTGGGCRASNYIFLLRKALEKSGFGYVPVISLNFKGLEDCPGFTLKLSMLMKAVYAVILGDFLMLLANQCRPYEMHKGDTDALVEKWTRRVLDAWARRTPLSFRSVKKQYGAILEDFAALSKCGVRKPRVGIVGEIYVKYSPLANNHLEDFLQAEGAEVVVPGLMDFCMYCINNGMVDRALYGASALRSLACRIGYRYFVRKQRDMIQAIREHGVFRAPMPFPETNKLAGDYISHGVKMGEGWLLTVEMAELIAGGVDNIVCAQPFGCLPNHIVGKGMINQIKQKHPEANIVAIDYDPGASQVNQQNRIKMMLASALARQAGLRSDVG
nr:2-hydroxyacyl-CoA dehydratase [Maliibacterium massiliense]